MKLLRQRRAAAEFLGKPWESRANWRARWELHLLPNSAQKLTFPDLSRSKWVKFSPSLFPSLIYFLILFLSSIRTKCCKALFNILNQSGKREENPKEVLQDGKSISQTALATSSKISKATVALTPIHLGHLQWIESLQIWAYDFIKSHKTPSPGNHSEPSGFWLPAASHDPWIIKKQGWNHSGHGAAPSLCSQPVTGAIGTNPSGLCSFLPSFPLAVLELPRTLRLP